MRRAADNIPYFFLVSCLLHVLFLWGMDLKNKVSPHRLPAPVLRFVFSEVTAAAPGHPVRAASQAGKRTVKKDTKAAQPLTPKETVQAEKLPPKQTSAPANEGRMENETPDVAQRPSPCPFLSAMLAGTAGSGTNSSPGPASAARKHNVFEGYLALIRTLLEEYKEYPLWAQRNNREGTVGLHFVICRDGKVEDLRVARSSGFSILDEAAERTVRRISRFPSIPEELAMNRLSLDVPLVFKLVNR
ncbi:MAG: energy transducer TonB [Thermodesulfobacteriota bacterium]|nr:energy transducer TonB [Thermodesulfobacteriota bacterium]